MKTKFVASILVFLSGFAGLVYQVLWMRQLGLLFGNTARAAGMTLAVFFAGLAVGSAFWGQLSKRSRNPMRGYAYLEVGIGTAAIFYFGVLYVFRALYPVIYQGMGSGAALFAVKCLLAVALVFPPAFFMGGTIPFMGQAVIRDRARFGAQAAWLYGINTFGAAMGALLSGFVMVRTMGFTWTCVTAIVTSVSVAIVALVLAGEQVNADHTGLTSTDVLDSDPGEASTFLDRFAVAGVAFVSGFGVLALEVIWTRLFAQVHTNSVYSFAAVLGIVLVALALGAWLASWLARIRLSSTVVLTMLLLLGGALVMLFPHVFIEVTQGFRSLDTSGNMASYFGNLLGKGILFLGIPAVGLGVVFPYTMKAEERLAHAPGAVIGRLSAINTGGAILGALTASFVLLQSVGLWLSVQLIAALYLFVAILLPRGSSTGAWSLRSAGGILLLLLFTVLSPTDLRVTARDRYRGPERLLEVWETSDGTVAVSLSETDECVITLNSNYRLGSTGAAWRQHFQGRIPLLVYPGAESVFFLGMGTGISVGGALDPRFDQVERVVACELVPEVVDAARKYMTGSVVAPGAEPIDFTSGLFTDDRVEIVIDDGRHVLAGSGETFDIINADLFLPYRSGAGSLYSREHFESVKAVLNPGGVFVQWLPMYQLTESEFGTIARTMLEVFDQVTVWRNNFKPGQEVLGLMGHRDRMPLPAAPSEQLDLRRESIAGVNPLAISQLDLVYDEENVLIFYAGNLSASRAMFEGYPLNTDDRPVIEYNAPFSMRKREGGYIPTIVGTRYDALVSALLAACPPAEDPVLANRTSANQRLVLAGAELHRFWLAKAMGDTHKANAAWHAFARAWTGAGAPE